MDDALGRIAAIGGDGGADTLLQEPGQHLARVGGELQLQQLVPHLLLLAAQIDDVFGEHDGPRQDLAAKGDEFVHRAGDVRPASQEPAQIDETVAGVELLGDIGMECAQPGHVAMNGRNRPDPAGLLQDGEFVSFLHGV